MQCDMCSRNVQETVDLHLNSIETAPFNASRIEKFKIL
jgi:hypothetical protein